MEDSSIETAGMISAGYGNGEYEPISKSFVDNRYHQGIMRTKGGNDKSERTRATRG
jgi:hypothetical protein